MKNYPLLLRKFMADKGKVPSLVEIILHMNLELYSLKRQENVSGSISCQCKLVDTVRKMFNVNWLVSCVSEFQKCSSAHKRSIF